ncbi:MAG: ChbG/HpnK family deacetylase [Negativicutes bacterium]|nr:ChbG/HpnK family deacetylase [Negativicutes bacterium]
MKKLIINADDFGVCPAVNQAVVDAYSRGVLTSASLMAGGRAYRQAVDLAVAHRIPVGVHLTLCGGEQPVAADVRQVSTLVDCEGRLYPGYREFILACVRGRIDYRQVRRELAAQIERVSRDVGRITHLDSHQHLHLWPPIATVVIDLAKQYRITKMRTACELPDSWRICHQAGLGRKTAGRGLAWLGRRLQRRLSIAGIGSPEAFCGFLSGGRNSEQLLLGYLAALAGSPAGSCEIMVHPATDNQVMTAVYNWGYDWHGEYRSLLSPAVRQFIDSQPFELVDYQAI